MPRVWGLFLEHVACISLHWILFWNFQVGVFKVKNDTLEKQVFLSLCPPCICSLQLVLLGSDGDTSVTRLGVRVLRTSKEFSMSQQLNQSQMLCERFRAFFFNFFFLVHYFRYSHVNSLATSSHVHKSQNRDWWCVSEFTPPMIQGVTWASRCSANQENLGRVSTTEWWHVFHADTVWDIWGAFANVSPGRKKKKSGNF